MSGIMSLTTLAQIKAFQRKHGLVVDGIVGPQTRKVLAEVSKPPATRARVEPDKSAINVPLARGVPPLSYIGDAAPGKIDLADTARPLVEIIVHCTATPAGRWFERKDVNAWHKRRGWAMIGYHYLVLLDGRIVEGRPIGMIGAHVEAHNTGTIGVAYVGGLSADCRFARDTRTPQQQASLAWLVSALKTKHRIRRRVRGHNEYDPGKACPSFKVPGDMLALL